MHQTELIGGGGDSLLVPFFSLYTCSAASSKVVSIAECDLFNLPICCMSGLGEFFSASNVYLMVFRSTSTSASRLAEKPGQDTQLITVDEKLVRIPPRST